MRAFFVLNFLFVTYSYQNIKTKTKEKASRLVEDAVERVFCVW